MKRVDIIEGKMVIHDVPDNYRQCSVTGTYTHPVEFMVDGKIARTNNEYSYHLPIEEFNRISNETKELMNSQKYRDAVRELASEQILFNYSMTVREMIESLQKLNPDDRLCVTQEGYYADGMLADVYQPELYKEIDGVKIYSIGHSAQNY